MSEMVDRVAAAINGAITLEIAGCMDAGCCEPRDRACHCTIILARAAIEAMREPPDEFSMGAERVSGNPLDLFINPRAARPRN